MDEVKEDYEWDTFVDDDYDDDDDAAAAAAAAAAADDDDDAHAGKSVLLVGFAWEGAKFTGDAGFCDSYIL